MVTVKKFWASYCGPCRMLKPVLAEVVSNYSVGYMEIDVENSPQIAEQYGVRSIPTVIIEKNGQELARFAGVQSRYTYENAINEAIKN